MDVTSPELFATLQAAKARHALFLGLLQAQRKTSDPSVIMRNAAEAVGRFLQVDRVGFFEMDGDDTLKFSVGWTGGSLPLLTGIFPAAGIGTNYLAEVRAGKTLGISDARFSPLTADSIFSEIGTVSLIGVPIIRNGQWHAGLYINHSEVRHWTEDEVALAREVGEQTWDAVERARTESELRKSQERLTLALEAGGGVGTWDWDVAANRVYSDARFAYLFSVDPACAAAGVPVEEFINGIHPEDRALVGEKIRLTMEEDAEYSLECRVLPADGSVRWVYGRGICQRDASGTPLRMPGVVFDITDRKQTEMRLRQQWHTFDVALSFSPDFTYMFDLEGRFTYSNRSLLLLLGKALDEVVGKNFYDLDYPPELAERLQRQIQRVIDTKHSLRDQTPFTGVSGDAGVYEYIFVPVLGEGGKVESVAGSTRDVTERSRAEKLIEEDRGRWRDLLSQAPAGIAVLRGPLHRFEWVNDEYIRLIGRPAESLIGKTVMEAVPEVEGQVYMKLLDGVYQSGEPFFGHEALLRLDRGDGTLEDIYVNFVYLPTRNEIGKIDGIFVHVSDVTDSVAGRKQVEESERRFRQLANSMPQFVWTARPDGVIDYHNERWYNFTGIDRSLGGDSDWISVAHPDDGRRINQVWRHCVESGEAFQMETRFWDRHEKRWRWIMARAVAVRDESGQVVKWFGTGTDIDELRATQQALLQTQKLESIGLLAGGIAHDFNNLLVGIMGGASFALDTIPASHPSYSILQGVVESSERAAHLTRQMLAYAGKGTFITNLMDLSEVAVHSTQLVKASIPNSVQVNLQLAENLPLVETDPGQMQQVVTNLVINAAEAMGERNGLVIVRTRAEEIAPGELRRCADGSLLPPGLYAVLEVEDSGSGIEATNLAKIFDPFFTTKFLGRGLGLAAVSGVVRRLRGGIEVETEVGKGSTFRLLLPATARGDSGIPPRALIAKGSLGKV